MATVPIDSSENCGGGGPNPGPPGGGPPAPPLGGSGAKLPAVIGVVPEIKYGKPGKRFSPFSSVIDIMIPCMGRPPNWFSVLVLSIEMLISVLPVMVRAKGTSLHLSVPFMLMFAIPCRTFVLLEVEIEVLLLSVVLFVATDEVIVAFERIAPDVAAAVSFVIMLISAASASVPFGLMLSRFTVKF